MGSLSDFSPYASVLAPFIMILVGLGAGWIFLRGEGGADPAHIRNWRLVTFAVVVGTFSAAYQARLDNVQMKASIGVIGSMNAVRTLSEYINFRDTMKNKPQFFSYLYEKIFDRFANAAAAAKGDKYLVDNKDIPDVAIRLIQEAHTSIHATSYVSDNEWWRQGWGRKYLEENAAAVKRGVVIERIFIFPDQKSFLDDQDLLAANMERGIHVKYVLVGELGEPFTRDVIDVDGLIGGVINLSVRSIADVEFTSNLDDIDRTLNIVAVVAHDFKRARK